MSFFAVDDNRYLNIDHIESFSCRGPVESGEKKGQWYLQVRMTSDRITHSYYETEEERDMDAESLKALAAGMT